MKVMDFVRARGREITAGGKPLLLRGFGLGGWLLPEGYMWKFFTLCDRPRRMEALICDLCGADYAAYFWQRYRDTYITREDIAWIAREGFNSIRLPLNARHMTSEETWQRIDDCVSWCGEYGLYLILDMHAAPGGQTGQNIDDSENDQPELFQNRSFQEDLISLWRRIAARYRDEKTIAGYDLLNEPLPEFFSGYNDRVLPLYREITKAIREVDPHHMIIVEGVHWATDFSIFDPLRENPLDGNCMLQFHRYWSPPDQAGIQTFLNWRDKLCFPLFMGEGGENNLDWYKAAIALYERHDISWSFWTYKKMDCHNSPVSFPMPPGWPMLIKYLEGGPKPGAQEARRIFDGFLEALTQGKRSPDVIRALKREAPIIFPAEHFDRGYSALERVPGADFQMGEPLSILFHSGKSGVPNYQRMGGEPQPEDERMYVLLRQGERAVYRYVLAEKPAGRLRLRLRGSGTLLIKIKTGELQEAPGHVEEKTLSIEDWADVHISMDSERGQTNCALELGCVAGAFDLDEIEIM